MDVDQPGLWDRIRDAEQALRGQLPVSPLLGVATLLTADQRPVLLKAECLMPTGSFKIRGATYKISCLSAEERRRGVVAYSTGNHAQAVARAAADAGSTAVIVMSPDVNEEKLAATRRCGAEIVFAEIGSTARRELAEQIAVERGLALVPPYDDLDVMAGQGTIGLELACQWGDHPPAAVYVPIGGGGLIAGVACAVKHLAPDVLVVGVEPEWEDDAARSFRRGEIVAAQGMSESIADAIRVLRLGDLVFPEIRRYVDDIVTVSEDEIASATVRCATEAHIVVEPGGAVGIAGALASSYEAAATGPVVALACGGNVALDRLAAIASSVQTP